jgi:CRP/FNR family transcriptional regulator, cyclic AMP receptor protein
VKLSICATDGKTLILKIAEPGEVLGLSATVSGKPYELTAETTVSVPPRLSSNHFTRLKLFSVAARRTQFTIDK